MGDIDFGETTNFGGGGLVLDMTQVGDTFDILDPGTYPAFVFEIEAKESKGDKTKGTPMLKVTYRLEGGKGRVWDNIVLNKQSAWKFKQLATAAGIPASELTGQVDVAALIPQITGQQVLLKLAVDQGNERYPPKNVVDRVSALSEQLSTGAPQSFADVAWNKAN